MTSIYLAGSFSNKKRIESLANKLEKEGFEITQKWWESTIENSPSDDVIEWLKREEVKDTYYRNCRGVINADIVIIVFNHDNKPLQGALVELGIAAPFKNYIFAIGKPVHKSAMFYPIDRYFERETDLMELLRGQHA